MSLPNTFGSLTSATGAMLDANFAALGALTAVACTAAGSNAVTLTPQVNTPAVSAYANYMPFSFVIAASNTGATTLRIGSLAALPVYQDTATGPAVLSGGELVAGNAAYVVYDGALNGGSGGWHLSISSAAIKEPCYPVTGSSTRLIGYAPGGGSVASWSAGEFIATNPATGASVKALPLSTVSFNGLTSGANGMDTGAMDGPPVRYWVMGANEWRTAADWPQLCAWCTTLRGGCVSCKAASSCAVASVDPSFT